MKTLLAFCLIFLLVTFSCAHQSKSKLKPRQAPEHHGVDVDLQPFVEDFMALSKRHDLHFTHTVTAGFKEIGHPPVIGVCYFGDGWREIDIDNEFWEDAPFGQQKMLIFHELTHCYCQRGHDYADGKYYSEGEIQEIIDNFFFRPPMRVHTRPGYFTDGCPITIMHPVIVDEECVEAHEDHYVSEMFDRCKPY